MSLSRRELLTALVGAPLAVAACRRPPRAYPGQLLGAQSHLGHRLLDATLERVSTAEVEEVPIVIAGAGPSGLSAAWRLERAGEKRFRVLELEPKAGGTSAFGTSGVVPYPWGAHYVPVPSVAQPELAALLEEIGAVTRTEDGRVLGAEDALVRAPEERLFIDGAWHEGLFPSARATHADTAELARFERIVDGFQAFRDARGRRAFTLPLRECSDAAEITALDRISAARWFRERGFRSPLLRWYLEYACRDDYGVSLDETSAWAMLFYFCARVAGPGLESAPFLTWPEGNGRIVAHLSRLSGERLSLNQLVTDVIPGEDGVELVAYDAVERRARRYRAEHVILAVPKLVARRIVRPFREAPPAHLASFHYGAWLVANLHLSGRPSSRGFPFAWDNVLYDSPALGYVVASHQTLSDFGPTVWTYYRPFFDLGEQRARQVLYELDHRTAAEAIVSDLRRAHPDLPKFLERVDVYRWGHAMITPAPGFVWSDARKKAQEPLGRLVFAHSDLSGIPLFEEAFDRGLQAANFVLSRMRG
jgi:protoporphyrinogen oxidase